MKVTSFSTVTSPMTSIDFGTLLTTIFVVVDDWCHKQVMLSTWNGIPISYDIVPANTDERIAAEGVLETVKYSDIYADKGFISADWQLAMSSDKPLLFENDFVERVYARRTGNRIWTLTRDNQHLQHSHALKRFISRVRQRVEGGFHEI
ncbi:transposase [Dendronalium sp. ChiSLP03b]|uniref:transposase n=1 Tax=Dendronalium sp. ChiSLP03b TaxID=3075381 RepID=UPI002AD30CD7|nr:transposase [Dendronalium sp. ChiSLP03b]MDZ8207979.1 transposase [Dendronalium sp. ChiSLP03b]